MKKVNCFPLFLILVFSLLGCGGSDKGTYSSDGIPEESSKYRPISNKESNADNTPVNCAIQTYIPLEKGETLNLGDIREKATEDHFDVIKSNSEFIYLSLSKSTKAFVEKSGRITVLSDDKGKHLNEIQFLEADLSQVLNTIRSTRTDMDQRPNYHRVNIIRSKYWKAAIWRSVVYYGESSSIYQRIIFIGAYKASAELRVPSGIEIKEMKLNCVEYLWVLGGPFSFSVRGIARSVKKNGESTDLDDIRVGTHTVNWDEWGGSVFIINLRCNGTNDISVSCNDLNQFAVITSRKYSELQTPNR
ncbi:MAG: hypothetical protein HY962_06355 [Ignavibacteriae bacterium]|nr:hypothetical protein [Ignavibacteriota bacterium]